MYLTERTKAEPRSKISSLPFWKWIFSRSDLAYQFGVAPIKQRASGIDGNQARPNLQRFEFEKGLNTTETLEFKAVLILQPPGPVRV